jgi:type IV pilus assembly protein PilQ
MVKNLVAALIMLLGTVQLSTAGQITEIRVAKQTEQETEIVIEGRFDSYGAVGLKSPARFVINLEGAQLAKGVPRSLKVRGPLISEVLVKEQDDTLRIVLYSEDTEQLFYPTVQAEQGLLVVKCSIPKKPEGPSGQSAGSDYPGISASDHQRDLRDLFGWPEEGKIQQEKKEEKKISKYSGDDITVDFYKTDIHNVFRIFAEISGKNILLDDQVSGKITMALKRVPWDAVMDIILEEQGLIMEQKPSGICIVKPKPREREGRGELIVKIYPEKAVENVRRSQQEMERRQRAYDLILRADTLEKQGKRKEAVCLYETALKSWSSNIALIKKISYLDYILGDFANSYFYAGQALKLNPFDAEASLYAALSAARMGKKTAARKLFDMATTQANPKIPEAFYNYGLFLEKEGSHEKALRIFGAYEATFGPNLDVRMAMARLYESQKRTKTACETYREVITSGLPMEKRTRDLVQKKINALCSHKGK